MKHHYSRLNNYQNFSFLNPFIFIPKHQNCSIKKYLSVDAYFNTSRDGSANLHFDKKKTQGTGIPIIVREKKLLIL